MPAGDTGGYVQKTVNKSRFIPAVIWMYVIYWLSDKPAVQSTMQSESLALRIVKILTAGSSMSDFDRIKYAIYLDPIIREMAHFLEYAVLAVFVIIAVGAFVSDRKKAALISIIICFLYACTDEWHQSFVPGRAPEPFDIILDTAGAAVVIVIFSAVCYKRSRDLE